MRKMNVQRPENEPAKLTVASVRKYLKENGVQVAARARRDEVMEKYDGQVHPADL